MKPLPKDLKDALSAARRRIRTERRMPMYQQLVCVLMREKCPRLTAADIAEVLGVTLATVYKIHSDFLRYGIGSISKEGRRPSGGRGRRLMSINEEHQLFVDYIAIGATLTPKMGKEILENALGRIVPMTTVYRVLRRNGFLDGSQESPEQ